MSAENKTRIFFERSDTGLYDDEDIAYVLSEEELAQLARGTFCPPQFDFPGHWIMYSSDGGRRDADGIILGSNVPTEA